MNKYILHTTLILFLSPLFQSCKDSKAENNLSNDEKQRLQNYQKAEAIGNKNLKTFDNLDYIVFSNQQWDKFHESHAENIIVHYPDGSKTLGIQDHIEKLKPTFSFMPDLKIIEHPIRIADGKGQWTSVIGKMTGTFTQPMDLGNGTILEPTGNKINLNMSTVARWENGKMVEEYLFYDNQAFMQQLTQ